MKMDLIDLGAVKSIRFARFGEPKKVLQLGQCPLVEWDGKSVLVRWLASPVNPVDLYIVRGQYGGYKPKLPAVAGVEGVGIVEKMGRRGAMAEGLQVGDRVIRYKMPSTECPREGGLWAECSLVPAESLLRIDPAIELVSAATLALNPATAFAMLREMVPLERGDCIAQNGANSGVGRAVIQE